MNESDDVEALRVKLCRLAEQVASGFNVTLDYSEESLEHVERILGELHEEYRETQSEKGIFGLALEFGAYIVTVLDRSYGPVDWQRDHPILGKDSFPLLWRETTIFPVGWCWKRIVDGAGDNILVKWKLCILEQL